MIAAMGEPTDPQPTVVVPVFNDWAALQMLAEGVAVATAGGPRPRLVIVDDGSSEPGRARASRARFCASIATSAIKARSPSASAMP